MILTENPYQGARGLLAPPCRRHVAKFDTSVNPGKFALSPLPAAIIPPALTSIAVECCWLKTNLAPIPLFFQVNDLMFSGNTVELGQTFDSVLFRTTVDGVVSQHTVPHAHNLWVHAVCKWEVLGGQARFKGWMNGGAIGQLAYQAIVLPWTSGINEWIYLGSTVPDPIFRSAEIAWARIWHGDTFGGYAQSDLPLLPYIPPASTADLIAQYTMGRGAGNVAYDDCAVADLPWVGVNQPNAEYGAYCAPGQVGGGWSTWRPL